MSLIFIVCVLVVAVSALNCPSCRNDCGDVGFLECNVCQCAPSCDMFLCELPSECILESVQCTAEPCPKMPTCVDLTKVCQGSPLRNHDSPVFCDIDTVECPHAYSCRKVVGHTVSVCCRGYNNEDRWSPSSQVIPDIFRPPLNMPHNNLDDDDDDDIGCGQCSIDPCQLIRCEAYPNAQCVVDDCSCDSWFIDQNAKRVDCYGGKPPEIPSYMRPFVEEDDDFVSTTTLESFRSPATKIPPRFLPDPDQFRTPIDPYQFRSSMNTLAPKEVRHNELTQDLLPSATTTKSATKTPKSLESQGDDVIVSDIIVHVVIATTAVFTCFIIFLVAYKVHRHRKKKSCHNQEDQLKPLQAENGDKSAIA